MLEAQLAEFREVKLSLRRAVQVLRERCVGQVQSQSRGHLLQVVQAALATLQSLQSLRRHCELERQLQDLITGIQQADAFQEQVQDSGRILEGCAQAGDTRLLLELESELKEASSRAAKRARDFEAQGVELDVRRGHLCQRIDAAERLWEKTQKRLQRLMATLFVSVVYLMTANSDMPNGFSLILIFTSTLISMHGLETCRPGELQFCFLLAVWILSSTWRYLSPLSRLAVEASKVMAVSLVAIFLGATWLPLRGRRSAAHG